MFARTVFFSASGSQRFPQILAGVALAMATAVVVGNVAGCRHRDPGDREILLVHAASSLTEAFQELEREFEKSHPLIDVSLVFSGSQVLRIQIEQGAPSDVLATANPQHAEVLVESGLIENPLVFARNELVLIVPLDNPAGIETFEDLPNASRLVIGTDQVPVGAYTHQMLDNAGKKLGTDFKRQVQARVVSLENNVRLVRAKVELGEADAAIVYRTDALVSDKVRSISIPSDINVQAEYFIGELIRSRHRELADDWIDFTLSPLGQQILIRHGFVEG